MLTKFWVTIVLLYLLPMTLLRNHYYEDFVLLMFAYKSQTITLKQKY